MWGDANDRCGDKRSMLAEHSAAIAMATWLAVLTSYQEDNRVFDTCQGRCAPPFSLSEVPFVRNSTYTTSKKKMVLKNKTKAQWLMKEPHGLGVHILLSMARKKKKRSDDFGLRSSVSGKIF